MGSHSRRCQSVVGAALGRSCGRPTTVAGLPKAMRASRASAALRPGHHGSRASGPHSRQTGSPSGLVLEGKVFGACRAGKRTRRVWRWCCAGDTAQRRTQHFVEGHGYRVLLVREQALHVLDHVAFLLLVRGAARLQAELGPSLCGAKGVKFLIHAQRVVVLRRHVDARGAVQDLRHPRDLPAQ